MSEVLDTRLHSHGVQDYLRYLGREHFLDFAGKFPNATLPLARNAFGSLVSRRAYPLDRRQVDFEALGLEIVSRDEAGMGKLPDSASYSTSAYAENMGRLAVGTLSLIELVPSLEVKRLDFPRSFRFGLETLHFLEGMVRILHPTQT